MNTERIDATSEYLASQGLSDTFPSRFWKKVNKTDGCWIWTASIVNWGYGKIGTGVPPHSMIYSHRASWIIHWGAIPENSCVLHRCDNPGCVNPEHLFLGTPKINTLDAIRKGRLATGERHGSSKLSWDIVKECRQLYFFNRFKHYQLAARFGVSTSTMREAVIGITWKSESLSEQGNWN